MKKIVITTNAYGILDDYIIDYNDKVWAGVLAAIKDPNNPTTEAFCIALLRIEGFRCIVRSEDWESIKANMKKHPVLHFDIRGDDYPVDITAYEKFSYFGDPIWIIQDGIPHVKAIMQHLKEWDWKV